MKIFVYDASGRLSAEYSTTVVPQAQAKVTYMTTDHLGWESMSRGFWGSNLDEGRLSSGQQVVP